MENVVLVIHLLLALALIGVVLLQRSEGGGLGMGGGGGGGGVMSGRSAATALGKVTWILAVAFICTSIALTIIAAQNSAGTSVVDRLGVQIDGGDDEPAEVPDGESLLPPSAGDNAPLVPSVD
ncbi:MAG: preprotein translocase subunit SecG [Pseudomonadota bacterium]